MDSDETYTLKDRLFFTLKDIWPTIYRVFNDLLFGFIHFMKDLLSGLWR